MSEKRRDNRNRILRTGESQRKDGRYAYKYIDTFGNPQFVYAWKLVPTDKTPAGKREDISLREKEKEIQEDSLGACSIESVKLSDAKEWALRMKDKGYSFKTINNHKRSLKAAFYTAIQDDCIRKNPFDFQLNTVLEDNTEPKVPLSPTQEASFLSFVQSDKVYQKYYDEIIILLGTGLRISELCGLTESDIDFEHKLINVAVNFETMFRGLVKKYNKSHEEALPKVTTPHTLRHTFCTNLANAGMNPKALQYIMGHSNINMTLNYYAHATSDSAMAEMERLIA